VVTDRDRSPDWRGQSPAAVRSQSGSSPGVVRTVFMVRTPPGGRIRWPGPDHKANFPDQSTPGLDSPSGSRLFHGVLDYPK
jgi:hypothetical protein